MSPAVRLSAIAVAVATAANAQPVDQTPPTLASCVLLASGIQSKEATLYAWNLMLLTHIARTADNVVAFPGTEREQLDTFERGLRRARQVDAQIRSIIERVYNEPLK